jgi:hypothetical protein
MSEKKYINKFKPDLPLSSIALLALLFIPRVVFHDLKLIAFDAFFYKFLAVAPLIIVLLVALLRRTKRPFYDFLLFGLMYGLFLALTHQILWDVSWGSNLPHIGGNLEGKFSPVTEGLILRTFAFISSVITGLVAGVAFGVIATVAAKIRSYIKKSKE